MIKVIYSSGNFMRNAKLFPSMINDNNMWDKLQNEKPATSLNGMSGCLVQDGKEKRINKCGCNSISLWVIDRKENFKMRGKKNW